jgi:hypothetical protein
LELKDKDANLAELKEQLIQSSQKNEQLQASVSDLKQSV